MDSSPWPGPAPDEPDTPARPEELLRRVARGDEHAFEQFYGLAAPPVFGIIRRLVRDPAQSEEVAQEVFVELWRTATRYHPGRGGALTWALTVAHRRAVDRVRAVQARADQERRAARLAHEPGYDMVAETVSHRLEREQVRRCLDALTRLQRESVTLAYYDGRTYRQVAELLATPLGTVKARLRDGLIRLRDCLGAIR